MKYKSGDKVRCIETKRNPKNPDYPGKGYRLGRVFTINYITDNSWGDGDILWPTRGSYGIYARAVELDDSADKIFKKLKAQVKRNANQI